VVRVASLAKARPPQEHGSTKVAEGNAVEPFELTGPYTYRSFLNEPAIVGDFNKLQFAEAELTLVATLEGKITGLLSWPTKSDDSERAVMTIEGQIVSRDPGLITLHG